MTREQRFDEVLNKYARVAIAGGPHVGKTTMARAVYGRPVVHTDEFMGEPWEQVPFTVIDACAKAGPRFVVEGVQVPRALRKGLEVDCVVWMDQALSPVNSRQISMGKGVRTVFDEWHASNPDTPVVRL